MEGKETAALAVGPADVSGEDGSREPHATSMALDIPELLRLAAGPLSYLPRKPMPSV